MKILQFFYENPPEFKSITSRKIKLDNENTLIKGARFCGKKSLVCEYLSEFEKKEFLFLDFEDLRFDELCLENLENFLQDKDIKIIVFYAISKNFHFKFTRLLKQHQFILVSEFKDFSCEGFKETWLDFLDFEEFLSLSANFKENNQIGMFLQNGKMPYKKDLQEYFRAYFSPLELEILRFIATNLGQEFSILELYKDLKKRLKISKDSVYKAVKELENRYIIRLCPHKSKDLRRVYFGDFALKNALSLERNFKNTFSNAIFCELAKFKEQIFYSNSFDFYLAKQKKTFIATPLQDSSLLLLRAKKILPKALEEQIFHIIFISLSTEAVFFEKGVKFEIIPFDTFALSF